MNFAFSCAEQRPNETQFFALIYMPAFVWFLGLLGPSKNHSAAAII